MDNGCGPKAICPIQQDTACLIRRADMAAAAGQSQRNESTCGTQNGGSKGNIPIPEASGIAAAVQTLMMTENSLRHGFRKCQITADIPCEHRVTGHAAEFSVSEAAGFPKGTACGSFHGDIRKGGSLLQCSQHRAVKSQFAAGLFRQMGGKEPVFPQIRIPVDQVGLRQRTVGFSGCGITVKQSVKGAALCFQQQGFRMDPQLIRIQRGYGGAAVREIQRDPPVCEDTRQFGLLCLHTQGFTEILRTPEGATWQKQGETGMIPVGSRGILGRVTGEDAADGLQQMIHPKGCDCLLPEMEPLHLQQKERKRMGIIGIGCKCSKIHIELMSVFHDRHGIRIRYPRPAFLYV